ncbi:regulator of Vps4 activity in the MVB pathway-domain-containing protein [Aspergillus carlsbadensis]|nr:regulator of Vps4 activity in the MVB pathway-domain-containing protein [Aspergillus carlsbadensis]
MKYAASAPASAAKLTSTLHLLIPRLRLLQKKSTASSVVQRRDLASLLENNRDASARIRVENVIATDIAIEVMEMVELYCELLLARAGVLDQLAFGEAGQRMRVRVREEAVTYNSAKGKGVPVEDPKGGGGGFFGFFGGKKAAQPQPQPQQQAQTQRQDQSTPSDSEAAVTNSGETFYLDPALDEAATVIFYAWSRFPSEVRELTLLRSLLADRYGKDYMTLASENRLADIKVPERLVKGLRVRPPSAELVESYLIEIARAYKVPWGEDADADDQEVDAVLEEVLASGDDVDGDGNGDGGNVGELVRRASETTELTRATPPRGLHADKLSGKSPVSVAPPGPRSDNPNPRVKVPEDKNAPAEVPSPSPAQRGGRDKNGIPEVDELSRRFAALKR